MTGYRLRRPAVETVLKMTKAKKGPLSIHGGGEVANKVRAWECRRVCACAGVWAQMMRAAWAAMHGAHPLT